MIGGLIGGVLMGMVSMVLFVLTGRDFWQPMRLIATLLLGPGAAEPPGFALGPVIVGMMIHLVLSMIFGVAMLWVARRLPGELLVKTIILSLILWVITNFVVLPFVDRTFYEGFPWWIFAIGHVMYGIGLGGYWMAWGRSATA